MRRFLHQRLMKNQATSHTHSTAIPTTQPKITLVDFLDTGLETHTLDSIEQIIPSVEKPNPIWIDIIHASPEMLQRLGEIFSLHRLTLEDILHLGQRPKVENFDTYMYIVIQKPGFITISGKIQVQQVSILLTPHTVVSIHEYSLEPNTSISLRMSTEYKRIQKYGTDYLAYVIVDSIVDEYFVTMEQFENSLDSLEETLAKSPTNRTIEQLHSIRQELIVLRKSVWPLRELISNLYKTESPLFDQHIKVYLKDLQDHILKIVELIELYREMAAGILDIYLSTLSYHTNRAMKTLTMIAAIFIPLTFITGLYGMNFQNMPELNWKYGYPAIIGVMCAISLVMVWFFQRRGWLS